VNDELAGLPEFVRDFVNSVPGKNIQHIELTEEAIWLGGQYIKEEVVISKRRWSENPAELIVFILQLQLFGKLICL